MLQQPITFINNVEPVQNQPEEIKIDNDIINLDFFTDPEKSKIIIDDAGSSTMNKPKRKSKKKTANTTDKIVKAEEDNKGELPFYQTNEPYKNAYVETDNLLRSAVCQIDELQAMASEQLVSIKNSRTLKKKYDYITDLTSTISNLVNTKVSAIREMNKTITDCNNLELKRVKDLKLNQAGEENDDKSIMDMYNAFISTPLNQQIAPGITDLSFLNGSTGLIRADIGADPMTGQAMQQEPMNSAQNMMRLEKNPDIKTVVVYDATTGNRFFDVINVKTGESIPNVEKPDPMFLEDTVIDERNRIARNTNLDMTYDLVVLNEQNLLQY